MSFIGRAQLTSELESRLGEAACGRGQLVLLAGEAGVGNVETSAAVSVYPNPTEGFVNVNAADEVISVEAYAADGRLAARSEGESGIDLSQCAPGIYMLKVATAAGTTVSRVVKK